MRHGLLATVIAASVVAPFLLWGAGQSLSITNYQFVSSTPVTATKANVTYRATLVNPGSALASVTASLTSLNPSSFTVVEGQGKLMFGPVPANSETPSSNTFTILVDRSLPFDLANLQWSFATSGTPPVANAGPDQTVRAGATVTLNGSASTNPSGKGTLTYAWGFTQKPAGSAARLSNPAAVMPTFVADLPGTYTVLLIVSNGDESSSASVNVSTTHSPPIADAGPNQTAKLGSTVILNGAGSSSPDGRSLTYKWTLTAPPESTAVLAGANTVSPSFVVDKFGDYTARLAVSDGMSESAPSTTVVSTSHTAPVANAGPNQVVAVNAVVQLNGAASTDIDGNLLAYSWSLISTPAGSAAALSNPTSVNPTFTADRPGTYIVQLIVSDTYLKSAPATVTISTNAVLPPTASAGPNQTVERNHTVTLSGAGTDPQALALTYKWSLITKPTSSQASLSNATIPNPVFVADFPGQYIAQLITNNGFLDSAPSTATITTNNTPPVANPGPDQSVKLGANVMLDGSASYSPNHSALTFSWSFTSTPPKSAASLTAASSSAPMFVADKPGTYVAQLIVNDGYSNSAPKTTAVITGVSLTPNPLNLTTAATGQLTVTLPSPALADQVVALSSDPSVVNVPANVIIPAGSSQTQATITPVGPGSATILAQAQGSSIAPGSASVNVTQATISLTPNPMTVGLTRTRDGTITLNGPAPSDTTITLTSSNTAYATVTGSVIIPAGLTSGTFTVTGVAVTSGGGAPTITATGSGYASGTTQVSVVSLGKILLPASATVAPGQSKSYDVTLATGAPDGGATITLSSDGPNATITPDTVFIAAQKTTPATQPTLNGVALGPANITASSPGFIGDTEPVTVSAGLSFSPTLLKIFGNNTDNLTLTLSSPAPQAVTVNLQSSDAAVATVPASVTIQQSGTFVMVPVTALGLKNGSTTITATPTISGITGATATVTNIPLGQISLPSNATVALGHSASFAVTLPALAPQDVTITLSSTDDSTLTISPGTVTVLKGQSAPAAQPQITGMAVGSATINASGGGYGPNSALVNVTATASFPPGTVTIPGGTTQNVTLTLSATTPKALNINLHSDDAGLATVPAMVTIAAGANSVSVPITGIAGPGGSTLIHASAVNIPDATLSVTVSAAPGIILQPGVTVGPNQSAPIAVSLPAPAASNVTITLTSSNQAAATVTSTVTVSQNATSPVTQPVVNGLNFGSTNITASAAGYASATQQVVVAGSLSLPPGPLSIKAGNTLNVQLTLSSPAPSPNGLTVNLASSNPGAATVPNTVTFSAMSNTVNVPVMAVALGPATITATANAPNVTPASVAVNVSNPGTITVPANISLAPNQSAEFTVSVNPAPLADLSITLGSSDPTTATVTPTVLIKAGSTAPTTQPTVKGVNFGTATITIAADGYLPVPANPTVTVGAALSFPPGTTSVVAGSVRNLTLSLSAAAPSSFTVNLSSSNLAVATVPASITFPANETSVLVPVTGVAPGPATITASTTSPAISSASADVSVVNGIILPVNTVVQPGYAIAAFPVSLSLPASTLTFVTLTSSDPKKVALSSTGAASTTFSIQAGQTAPTVFTKVFGVDFGSAIITATASGYASVSTTVQVRSTAVFVPNTVNIAPGASKLVSLVMPTPAPNGITFSVSSDNPSVASVPASVTFPANATGNCILNGVNTCQIVISVMAGIQDSTLIHATALPFFGDSTATIIVGNPGPPVITNTSLAVGQIGIRYTQQLTGDQGIVPYTWSLASGSPQLPDGLTLDAKSGLISGTPTQTVDSDFTFQITDSATPGSQVGTKTLHLTVLFQGALFVSSSTLPNGVQNSPYMAMLAAAGGMPPYHWALASGSTLPNNLNVSDSGVVSGTPTTLVSNLPVTFQVRDSAASPATATKTLYLTIVSPSLAITTASLPNGVARKPYSFFLQGVGGVPPYTWSIAGGSLPPFYNLVPSTGEIHSDTGATSVYLYQVTFKLADSGGHSVTKTLFLNITDGSLQVPSSFDMPAGQVGVAYSFAPQATAGTPPYSWTIVGLPYNGLNYNLATGVVSGTPTASFSTRLKFTVTDSSSPPQQADVFASLTINPAPPTITTASLPDATVGAPYSASVAATGGTAPYAFSATGLPTGLSMDASGVISGTPTVAGTARNVTVTVTDSTSPTTQTAVKSFDSLAVANGIILPANVVAQPGFTTVPFPVTLSTPAATLTFVTLTSSDPSKVALSANGATSTTFSIQAGQTAPTTFTRVYGVNFGSATVTASATGYATATTTVQVSSTVVFVPNVITIPPGGSKRVSLVMPSPAPAGITVNLSADKPDVAILPASVSFAANGTGACQEVTGNTCQVVIVVNGAKQDSTLIHASALPFIADATATIIVGTPGPPIITTTSLPVGLAGTPYAQQLSGDQGIVPYSWSLAPGSLQLSDYGLTLDPKSGVISGTPTRTVDADFTFQVTDSSTPTAQIGTKTLHLTILNQGELFITTTSLPNAVQNSPYDAMLTAIGGTTPYTWSLAPGSPQLPQGLTLDPVSGVISGTPTVTASNVMLTFQVTDSASPSASRTATLSLTVSPAILTITTTSLPDAVILRPYTAYVQASGGAPPYQWSIISGHLPGGYILTSLPDNRGEIFSDIGASCICDGRYQMAFQVKDSKGQTATAILAFFMTDGSLQMLSTSMPAGQVGVPYSFTPQAKAGTPPYSWSVGGLPYDGLNYDPKTGTVTGTPPAPLSTNFKFTVTDSSSPPQQAYAFLRIVITNVPPFIATGSLANGAVGMPYSGTVTAQGGTPPYIFSAPALAGTGLTMNSSGVISGTPTASGTINNVVVTVNDSTTPTRQNATKTFSITIQPQLKITTASPLPDGQMGVPYSVAIGASGGAGSYTWSATGVSAVGLSIDPSSGVISGTPTIDGTFTNVVVSVSDAGPPVQAKSATYSITLRKGFSITTASPLPPGVQNIAYSMPLNSAGGTGSVTWSAANLPANLAIDPSTGIISGMPAAAGATTNIMVTATDSASPPHTATATFSLTIASQVAITTTLLPDSVLGALYSATVIASGGTTPYAWSATGLPAGLSINPATGVISGKPTGSTSTAVITVNCTNPAQSTTANLTIKVVTPPILTTTALPAADCCVPYNKTVTASGGTPPYSFSATGLPSTLTMASNGQITGTPTAAFSGNISVTVSDSSNPPQNITGTVSMTINGPLQITTSSPLASGAVNVNYTGPALQATGGQTPYAWTGSGFPDGLSINTAGQIVGKPTSPGSWNNIAVTVTDALGSSVTSSFSMTIVNPLTITNAPTNGIQFQPYSFQMQASGGQQPYTWSGSGFPSGLSISSSGLISGTPTGLSTSSPTIMLRDANNSTVGSMFSITITLPPTPILINGGATFSIGRNLQRAVTMSLALAPTADVQVTVTSGNGSILLLNGTAGPKTSVTVTWPANVTSIGVNAIGVAVGQTTLSVSGLGGGNSYAGSATANVTPSGFALSGPNGPAPSTFSINQGQQANLAISVVQLDSSGNILATGQNLAPGVSATVPLTNSNTACGSVAGSVSFVAGDSVKSTSFTATVTGSAAQCTSVITALAPSDYSAPANNANVVTGNVSGVSCSLPNLTVGRNLAASANVSFNGVTPTGLQVTIQSTDSSKILVACAVGAPDCTGTLPGATGAAQITLTMGAGATRSPNFYVYGINGPATTGYGANCGSFGSDSKTVTVTSSGFVIGGASGPGKPIAAGIGPASAASLTISSAPLDQSLNPMSDGQGGVITQPVAPGLVLTPVVNLTDTDIPPATNVGSISPTSVTFGALQATASAVFTGSSAGKATLAAVRPSTPAGFSTPAVQYSTVTATVFASTLAACGDGSQLGGAAVSVGYNLEFPCRIQLSQPAAAAVTVTLSASGPLLISTDPTQAGQPSLTVTIPQGQSISNLYYLQAMAPSGTATYTADATAYGYVPVTGTVNLMQSGIALQGPNGQLGAFGAFTTSLSKGPATVSLFAAMTELDPTQQPFGLVFTQMLAGGLSVPLSISLSNPTVGSISSPTVNGGAGGAIVVFTPTATGQSNIIVAVPNGFTSTGYQTISATVTP